MDLWNFSSPVLFIFIGGLVIGLFFVLRHLFGTVNKIEANKALLKELLEGFDLDVPPELNNNSH